MVEVKPSNNDAREGFNFAKPNTEHCNRKTAMSTESILNEKRNGNSAENCLT